MLWVRSTCGTYYFLCADAGTCTDTNFLKLRYCIVYKRPSPFLVLRYNVYIELQTVLQILCSIFTILYC